MAGHLFVVTVLCLVATCKGVELTLDRPAATTSSSATGARAVCGVLVCEEGHASDMDTSTADPTDKKSSGKVSSSILSMDIYKRVHTTSGQDNNGERDDKIIASLTTQKPGFTRASDGVVIKGLLTPEQATIRVELVKQDDCHADFRCQVAGVDSHGKEFTRSARLLQQPDVEESQVDDGSLTSMVSFQLLTLAQQLSEKLALVTSSVERLEVKLGSLEKSSGDSIRSLESRIEDRIGSLEKDLRNNDNFFERRLEDKLNLFENRIEDKLENNNVLNKLYEIDGKMSAISSDTGLQFRAEIESFVDLLTLKKELKCKQSEDTPIGCVASDMFETTMNNMSANLSAIKKDFNELKAYAHSDSQALKNISESITEISFAQEILTRSTAKDFASVQEEKTTAFSHLESIIQNSSAGTHSALEGLLSIMNSSTTTSDLKSVIRDLISPKTCTKGGIPIPSLTVFPYPVVQPSQEGGLDVPFLCDTLTDGGGWIIIQRRTTGNVDFYRKWKEYKNGFGSLDDDFYIGNEKIHTITSDGSWELRIELKYKGKFYYAHFDTFFIAEEAKNYALRLGSYDGTAGDALSYHNGLPFSTYDRDNDALPNHNCASHHVGGWWYNDCTHSNLNGKWQASSSKGPRWAGVSAGEPVSFSEMKIRRV